MFIIVKSIYFGAVRGFKFACGDVCVSWKDLVCVCMVLLGLVLLLYGANSYGALPGWTGIFLIMGGIAAYVSLKVYEFMRKRKRLEAVEF
jgi:hypothetical protein